MEAQESRWRLTGTIIFKLVIAVLLMLFATGILSIPAVIYAILFSDVSLESLSEGMLEDPMTGLFMTIAQFLGVLLTVLIMMGWKKQSLAKMGWTDFWRSKKELGFGLVLGLVSITAIFLLLWAFGQITFTASSFIHPHFSSAFFIGFITFIFVAMNEELFFRGYVISVLKPTDSKWIIYIVSAVVFSCAHILNANVHILGLLNIVLIGLLFAYMFLKTNRLWMPIGYHLTWNFFQGNVWGFQVSGNNTDSLYQPKVHDTILTGGAFGPEAGLLTTIFIVIGFFITRWFLQSEVK